MKKGLFFLGALLLGAALFSCSDEAENNNDELLAQSVESYFTVENATYEAGDFPAATSEETLEGVNLDNLVQSGSTTTLSLPRNSDYKRYFIGVKGVPGYYVYTPQETRADSSHLETWLVPLNLGVDFSSAVLQISAEKQDGTITKPFEVALQAETPASNDSTAAVVSSDSTSVLQPGDSTFVPQPSDSTFIPQPSDSIFIPLPSDSTLEPTRIDSTFVPLPQDSVYRPQPMDSVGGYPIVHGRIRR